MCDCGCLCFWMDEQTEITEGLPVVEPTYAHPHMSVEQRHNTAIRGQIKCFFLVSFKYACACQ